MWRAWGTRRPAHLLVAVPGSSRLDWLTEGGSSEFYVYFCCLTTLPVSRQYSIGDRMLLNVEQLVERQLVGEPKYSERTCPSAISSITNHTRPGLRSNQGHGGGKPATTRLGYGTAVIVNGKVKKVKLSLCLTNPILLQNYV
jgi:hypothetical protein